jgi:hypothetical protein
MKKTLLLRVALISLSLFLTKGLSAQNVGINDDNSTPDPNAMLDVKSSSKGVLFPRMTTAQRTSLGNANPTEGMLVFDTNVEGYFFFVNGGWVQLASGSSGGGSVPVGTILAFAKDTADNGSVMEVVPGYLLCNGAEISSLVYPNLVSTIKTAWGNGDDTDLNTVNLPDLRGMFLRGVSGQRNDGRQDLNSADRDTMLSNYNNPPMVGNPAGNSGNQVGSYQGDIFKSHNHGGGNHRHVQAFSGYLYYRPGAGGWDMSSDNGEVHVSGVTGQPESGDIINSEGGGETRPRNAYVHYIIKF